MAQEVPTFKLVLVGDGGTGKVSEDHGISDSHKTWYAMDKDTANEAYHGRPPSSSVI